MSLDVFLNPDIFLVRHITPQQHNHTQPHASHLHNTNKKRVGGRIRGGGRGGGNGGGSWRWAVLCA